MKTLHLRLALAALLNHAVLTLAIAEPWIVTSYYAPEVTTLEKAETHRDFTLSAILATNIVRIIPTITSVPKPQRAKTIIPHDIYQDAFTFVSALVPQAVGTPAPEPKFKADVVTVFYVHVTYARCSGGPRTTDIDVVGVPAPATPRLTPMHYTTHVMRGFTTVRAELQRSDIDPAVYTSASVLEAPVECHPFRVATATAAAAAQPCARPPSASHPDFRCGPQNPCCKGCFEYKRFCAVGQCGKFAKRYFQCPDGFTYNVGPGGGFDIPPRIGGGGGGGSGTSGGSSGSGSSGSGSGTSSSGLGTSEGSGGGSGGGSGEAIKSAELLLVALTMCAGFWTFVGFFLRMY